MNVLRTPDERFDDLAGFDFAPHYVEVPCGDGSGTIRVHYIDEGPTSGAEKILLMHGEPSWCYLYRKMIGPLTSAGFRVIAPDLVGFGRSDKPARRSDYTYARHVEWMRAALFDELELSDLTLVGQDWGGLVGLRLVAEHPDRFRRVVAANTGLPTGDMDMGDAFLAWQKFSQEVPTLPVGRIVGGGCVSEVPPRGDRRLRRPVPRRVLQGGGAPVPDARAHAVPTIPPPTPTGGPGRSCAEFDKPFLCAFSDRDPITHGADRLFCDLVPGTLGQNHTTITGAGHFLQEDKGEDLASAVIDFVHLNTAP